jgi:hypothetical protein
MKKSICLAVGVVLLASCKTKTVYLPSQSKVIEKVEIVHERDTTVKIEQDSSWYKAWVECQDGKPVLRNPVVQKGKGKVKPPAVTLDSSGMLNIGCISENLELKFKLRDLETKFSEKETIIKTVEVARPLTFVQKLLIVLGKIFGAILIGLIGYGAFKIISKRYGK